MWQLLRTNRDLRALFVAQVVSFTGDWLTFVAIAGMVDEATGSPFLVSLAYVAFTLPAFIVSPLAGAVVDRVDRRQLLIVVSAAQALCAFLLLTATLDRVWPLFVFQSLVVALAAFVKPAIEAGVPNLARSPQELEQANALFGSTWGVMLAVGAGLGGIVSEVFGRSVAFTADGVSFLIALVMFVLISRPLQERERHERPPIRPFTDLAEVAHHTRRDPVLLALITNKATFGIGAAAVSQLPVLVTSVFGWGDGGTGLLLAARGAGAGLGPLIAARFVHGDLQRILRTCGRAGLVFTACYVGLAWSPVIAVAAVLVFIGHLGGGAQWMLSTYGLQVSTPDELRGRVLAVDFALVTLVMSAAGLAAGGISELVDVRWTITVFGGVATLAALGYVSWTRRIVRQT